MKNLTNRELSVLNTALAQPQFSVDVKLMAAAVTLTEMHFRPWTWRVAEFFLATFKLALGQDIRHLTLGVSQISVRYYYDILGLTKLEALLEALSVKNNLWLCCKLLEQIDVIKPDIVAHYYNGYSTIFYKRRLSKMHTKLYEYQARVLVIR